jgi:hypothetical protein
MTSPISNQDEILMTAIFSMDVYSRDPIWSNIQPYTYIYDIVTASHTLNSTTDVVAVD